ncbi:MAG TPA: hypothetical protein VHG30_17470 [Microvirga sp.]|nr:hypothetical protein [Microvirga sp.]
MPAYVIYHLEKGDAGHAPQALAQRIADMSARAQLELQGLWIVEADGTSDQIRDQLSAGIGRDEGLLVLEIGPDAAWTGVRKEDGEWLVEHLSGWCSWSTKGQDEV